MKLHRAAVLLVASCTAGCVLAYELADEAGEMDAGDDSDSLECTDGDVECGGACVDLQSDPDHCGVCGQVCESAMACDRGECRDGCRNGREICDRFCVDLDADPDHCGGCGITCVPGVACVDESCDGDCDALCDPARELCDGTSCTCRPGLVRCGDLCVDPMTDATHCGECDDPCTGDEACGAGVCVPGDCEGFADACGAACTNTDVDPLHCGECDRPCDADETCESGVCQSAPQAED